MEFFWILDRRYDDFWVLQDFEQCVVSKVTLPAPPLPPDNWEPERWEVAIYEDDACTKLLGRELFKTERAAKAFLEDYVVKTLKNKKQS